MVSLILSSSWSKKSRVYLVLMIMMIMEFGVFASSVFAASVNNNVLDDRKRDTLPSKLDSLSSSLDNLGTTSNCDFVKCPQVCPKDSYRPPSLVNLKTSPENDHPVLSEKKNSITPQQINCCPVPSTEKCQCIPNLSCSPKECPDGWTSHLISNASGEPGSCCPKFLCYPWPVVESLFFPKETDSVPLSSSSSYSANSLESDIGLDFDISFEENENDNDLLRQPSTYPDLAMIQKGQCFYNGQMYNPSETWSDMSECVECFCDHGIGSCKPINCTIPTECRLARADPLSCCPVCDGCVSSTGKAYNMSETWMEDPCTNCTCQAGRIQCHTSSCKRDHSCDNPKYFPGECCPRCESSSEQNICVYLDCHRDTSCSSGFHLDKHGCPTCECKKCNGLIDCKNDHHHPHQTEKTLSLSSSASSDTTTDTHNKKNDQSLSPLEVDQTTTTGLLGNLGDRNNNHEKKESTNNHNIFYGYGYSSPNGESSASSSSPTSGHHSVEKLVLFCALDSNGVRRMEGDEWEDKCRRCVCRNEQEMCSLITCPAPSCENPTFYPGDCCPRCPDDSALSFDHSNVSICMSSDGTTRTEGEIWKLGRCLSCTCHSGQVLCAAPGCPPAPCSSPKLVDCCFQCPSDPTEPSNQKDKHSFDTSSNGIKLAEMKFKQGYCLSDDSVKSYANGATWKVGYCQSCRCEYGEIKCFSHEKCPVAECARPVLVKNQCCPICLENIINSSDAQHKGQENISDTPTSPNNPPGNTLEPHCAVLIACLLVISIFLSLYIIRQVCFYRRGSSSHRIISKVPIGFHFPSSSSSPHSSSITEDSCYKCDFSKYCGKSEDWSGGIDNSNSSNSKRKPTSTASENRACSVVSYSSSNHTTPSSEQKHLFQDAPT